MEAKNYGRVVQRARLTRELQALRWERGETQRATAQAVDWSVSKLIRIETGVLGISLADLEYLLRHYGVTDELKISHLAELAREARADAWWDRYTINDRAFLTYIGYEAGAASIRMVQGLHVPDLLQTELYMRCIAQAYVAAKDELERVIAVRKDRQKEVLDWRQPEQIYVLDEAVLRRRVGDVMSSQLRHLVELAARPEISIHVIPFTHGPHFGMKGPFALLSFDPVTGLEDVLYLEGGRRGDLVEGSGGLAQLGDPYVGVTNDIAEYLDGFDSLLKAALAPDDSVTFIEHIANGIS